MNAPLAEKVDAPDLKSVAEKRAGSSPAGRTIFYRNGHVCWKRDDLTLMRHILYKNDITFISVTPQEYLFLICLIVAPGFVSRKDIAWFVWPDPENEIANIQQSVSRVLDNLKWKLRKLDYTITSVYTIGVKLERKRQWLKL